MPARSAAWDSSGDLLALGIANVVIAGSLRRTGDTVYVEPLSGVPFQDDLALDWRPGTKWLAGRTYEGLAFWEATSGALAKTRTLTGIDTLTWSPDGHLLSVDRQGGRSGIYRVSADPADSPLDKIFSFSGSGHGAAWSPTSDGFAYARGGIASLVDLSSSDSSLQVQVNVADEAASQGAICWSSSGTKVAVPSAGTIFIIDPGSGRVTTELKAHTNSVIAATFSPDSRLMASVGRDNTIRLWAVADWQLLATIELSDDIVMTRANWAALQFHPSLPLLCSVGTEGGASLYELDVERLLGSSASSVKRYATAKVVLVGESGVGKTGLGYRLATQEYKEHSSTHGQQFWVVDSLGLTRADGVRCEVVLWDLAGQRDYRLIHVLFLDDADAALVVVDASRRHELLDVAVFWIKALAAARPDGCVKVLVAARSDRGNAAVSAEELEEFAARSGVEAGFVQTSALTGDGLPELTRVLREHIRWNDLPMVVETSALTTVKEEVLGLKGQQANEAPLVSVADLQARVGLRASQAEIDASIRDLQVHGFVHLLRAADGTPLVLLKPELLNNLASSFVNEARGNERGLGALDEEAILAGRYPFPELNGISDKQRHVLTESAIVLFLKHNVCFREKTLDDRVLLIFPELINEKPPALADTASFVDDATYVVTGSIENVYASLVVLLGYTNVLSRKDQWRSQARYEMDRHLLHFRQERPRDDRLEIVLSYPHDVPASAKRVFQGLVEQFLGRRQVVVRMYPRVDCPECGYILPRAQVIQFMDMGKGVTFCPSDGHRIPLLRGPERVVMSEQERQIMQAEGTAAAKRTAFSVVATQLRGYLTEVVGRPQSLAVFISYPWGDHATERWVRDLLVPDLEQAGVEVVLDRSSTRVGESLTRFVERAQMADRVLVIATPEYARKYNNASGSVAAAEADVINLRLLGTEEQKSTVLPVLLAGSPTESLPALMQTRTCADFRDPDQYFIELFELVLALHGLAPEIPALKELRAALLADLRDR